MSGEPEQSGKNRDEKGRFISGVSGNPNGKPEGTISLLADVKRKLRAMKEKDPKEYNELINYYWRDVKMRDLLIKMVDGLPKQSIEHSGEVGLPYTIKIVKDEGTTETRDL